MAALKENVVPGFYVSKRYQHCRHVVGMYMRAIDFWSWRSLVKAEQSASKKQYRTTEPNQLSHNNRTHETAGKMARFMQLISAGPFFISLSARFPFVSAPYLLPRSFIAWVDALGRRREKEGQSREGGTPDRKQEAKSGSGINCRKYKEYCIYRRRDRNRGRKASYERPLTLLCSTCTPD